MLDLKESPHQRKNPLTGTYVLVSPHRMKRPWQGKIHSIQKKEKVSYDPSCYLCPQNKRVGGETNPDYKGPFVFKNDHSALLEETPEVKSSHPLLKAQKVTGTCRVFCFSEDHQKTLKQMKTDELAFVFKKLGKEVFELSHSYPWVQFFENRGELMGCSNPHPHGQLWAVSEVPKKVLTMDHRQEVYWKENKSCLLLDYAELEVKEERRIIYQNKDWLVLVPWWAEWPYQTMVLPRFKVNQLYELKEIKRQSLALAFKKLLSCYDNLFSCNFPYSMGWYGAPLNQEKSEHWQLHANFYPPLLRSATVQKYMVGYEMFAEPQRDITPEEAAKKIRMNL